MSGPYRGGRHRRLPSEGIERIRKWDAQRRVLLTPKQMAAELGLTLANLYDYRKAIRQGRL